MDSSDKVENTDTQHDDDEETSKQIDNPRVSTFHWRVCLENGRWSMAGIKWSQDKIEDEDECEEQVIDAVEAEGEIETISH